GTFRRLSYRALLGMPTQEPVEVERVEREYGHGDRGDRGDRGGRRRRRGGRGRGRGEHGAPRPVHQAPVERAPRVEPVSAEEPHTAPHDEIVNVVQDLARARGTVTLDSLANALKSRGFSRPPGSPRLITRLRRIKELDVNRAGVITLVGDVAAAEPAEREEPVGREAEPVAVAPSAEIAEAAEPVESRADSVEEPVEAAAESEPSDPGNREGAHLQTAGGGDGGRRRRSRRGGRR